VAPRRFQLGGTLTTIVILAAIGVLGYYAWKALMDDTPPTCSEEQNACLARCRKTATEAPAMQACQEECRRSFAACSGSQR
jgi:uncharacterized membrane protein YebE (DUF533 family)